MTPTCRRFSTWGSLALAAALLLTPTGARGQAGDPPPPPPDTGAARAADTVPRFALEEVRIEATRIDASVSELAASVGLVGRAEIESRPVRLVTDVIALEPGVLVQQTTAGQGAPFIRALTGSQVLLMVDGVRLNNGTFRQGPSQYLATVDPETVHRVEVVRGASSALHGSDAMGGVVNVITRRAADLLDPGERAGGEGSVTWDGATGGTRVRLTGAASLPGLLRGLDVFGGGSWQELGDLEPGGGLPSQEPTGFTQWGADLRADLRATDALRLELAGQHFRQSDVPRYDRLVDFRAPGLPLGGAGRNATYLFEPQDRTLLRARALWAASRSWLTTLEVQGAWQEQEEGRTIRGQEVVDGAVVPDSEVEEIFDGVRSLSLDVEGTLVDPLAGSGPFLAGALVWGAEVWDDRTDSRSRVVDRESGEAAPRLRFDGSRAFDTGRFPDDSRFRGAALYAFLDQRLPGDLRIQLGARRSSFRTETHVGDAFGGAVDSRTSDLSGEVGLVWSPDPRLDLRTRYAQAFRAPNIYDLTLVGDVPGGISLPNPGLEPERSWNAEVGARWTSGGVRVDATLHHMEIDGLIDRVESTFRGDTLFRGERVIAVENVGSARIRGVEAALALPLPADGTLRATAHWTRGDTEVLRDGERITEPLSRVPPPTLTGRARWAVEPAGLEAWWEYAVTVAGEQDRLGARDRRDSRIQEGGTPGYAAHSLRGSLRVAEGVRIVGGLENLLDELYRVHGSGIDAPGRHLWIRLDVRR